MPFMFANGTVLGLSQIEKTFIYKHSDNLLIIIRFQPSEKIYFCSGAIHSFQWNINMETVTNPPLNLSKGKIMNSSEATKKIESLSVPHADEIRTHIRFNNPNRLRIVF